MDQTLIQDTTDPRRKEHAAELQEIQHRLDTLKFQYRDHTLAFKALDLAWETTRLAWYAVHQETLEHLEQVGNSLAWVRAAARQAATPKGGTPQGGEPDA